MKRILLFFYLMTFPLIISYAQEVHLDNGIVKRSIDISDGHISTVAYRLEGCEKDFVRQGSPEFRFVADDVAYTGKDAWTDIQKRDTASADGGRGVVLSFRNPGGDMAVELAYMTYQSLPVVSKSLTVVNTGSDDMKIEAVDVEDIVTYLDPIESWTLRQYGRYKTLGTYVGNWDDPLVVVHDNRDSRGIAIGNEAIGVLKRTSVFVDGRSMTAGVTRPEQDYPFRRWLGPGERWTSPEVFTVLYSGTRDPYAVVNTAVADYVRRHMGIRIEELPQKPMFVYNTWHPFMRNIDEKMIYGLADAASECGVEEFVIDDGWQLNVNSPLDRTEHMGDWVIDRKKFPNGLKPVFDYIKSLGMKPGLWISLATADPSSIAYDEHPEWFVKGPDGHLTDLHNQEAFSRTACMGTDWYDYIKGTILRLHQEYGLAYVKLDLAILASAYVYSVERAGCYATDHPFHRDREESFDVIYERCMKLFDELHEQAPDLFIDCTFETAGKFQLMDYGIAKHAEGDWLSNVVDPLPVGSLRIRNLAWGRTPAIPATSLVIGNLSMEENDRMLNFKSLTGTLPIMLGDPRKLTPEERAEYKSWMTWLKGLEDRHGYMSFRQDVPGFGEPQEGCWDAFCRINTDTFSGGLVGVFNQGSVEKSRLVTIPYLAPDATYEVRQGFSGTIVAVMTGKELAEKGFEVFLDESYDGDLFEITVSGN